MTITIIRNHQHSMSHTVRIRAHEFTIDASAAEGGNDAGPSPHDLYDAALGACKALTVLWYAQRKHIAVEGIEVHVERDASQERQGLYRLQTTLKVTGQLSDGQKQELLVAAGKCPVHKLMTQARTEVETNLTN
jgi:putative redox protein